MNTLAKAINTLHCVKHLGYPGQLAWALVGLVEPPTEEWLNDYDVAAGAGVCFEVAKYLRFWLEAERSAVEGPPAIEPIAETLRRKDIVEPGFWASQPPGVYYVDLETSIEGHAFVLVLTETEVVYAGGYGGKKEFTLMTVDRREWQDHFTAAIIDHKLAGYLKAFGLSKYDIGSWSSKFHYCRFQEMTVERSARYN